MIMLTVAFQLQPAKYSVFLSVRQWLPSCMSDFLNNTISGWYEAELMKKHVEHWYDCTLLGLAAKQKAAMCAQMAIMGLVFVSCIVWNMKKGQSMHLICKTSYLKVVSLSQLAQFTARSTCAVSEIPQHGSFCQISLKFPNVILCLCPILSLTLN